MADFDERLYRRNTPGELATQMLRFPSLFARQTPLIIASPCRTGLRPAAAPSL